MAGKLPVDRRRFLQIAGGTVAATALSSSVARAATIAPAVNTGTIKDVEHIVILMQENRSFDHYFGDHARRPRLRRPAPGGAAQRPDRVEARHGVLPFHPTAANLGLQFLEDLPHDWTTTHDGLGQRQLRPVGAGQGHHARWRT